MLCEVLNHKLVRVCTFPGSLHLCLCLFYKCVIVIEIFSNASEKLQTLVFMVDKYLYMRKSIVRSFYFSVSLVLVAGIGSRGFGKVINDELIRIMEF